MKLSLLCSCVLFAAFSASADTVIYTLENVILTDDTQMTGQFSWTYDAGDFENGVGQFTSLVVPHTSHDHTDLEVSFDIAKSIEITLPGSFHDDGVDIMLLLDIALTPTTASRSQAICMKIATIKPAFCFQVHSGSEAFTVTVFDDDPDKETI